MEYRDYYGTLGVARDADEQTIKKAYRRLARTYHPDVNSDKEMAEKRFKEINEAYTVLSDSEKRKMYDSFGAEWERYQRAGVRPEDVRWSSAAGAAGSRPGSDGYAGRGAGRQGSYRQTMSGEDFARIFETIFGGYSRGGGFGRTTTGSRSSDFSDFFEALFGNWGFGGAAGWSRPARHPERGRDIVIPLEVTLGEAMHGATRTLRRGDGRRIEVTVPPGVQTGTRIRISRQGEPGLAGGQPGDLYLQVTVQAPAGIERNGDDLWLNLPVDLTTAVLGGALPVQGPDHRLVVDVPAGTRDGSVLRLSGQGMPNLRNPQRRGDLLARVAVGAPKSPTTAQRQAFKTSGPLPVLRNGAGVLASSQQVRKSCGIGLVAGGLLAMAIQPGSLGAAGLLLLPALILLFVSQASRLPKLVIPAGIIGLAGLRALAGQVEWQLLAFAGQLWPLLALVAGFALLIKVRNTARPAQRRPASP